MSAKTTIKSLVTKSDLLSALNSLTLRNTNFNSDYWSLQDALLLRIIAELIEREIKAKPKEEKNAVKNNG